MVRKSLILIAAGLFLTMATAVWAQSGSIGSTHHSYRVVTVAEGLEVPWSITFLPDGDMLVTERPGRLRIIRDGVLLPDSVPGVPEVHAEGQGGLFDVLPHPEFTSNRLLYLAYAHPNSGGSTTRVVRARFENDQLSGLEEIFLAVSQGRGHYGGKLAFDRNGLLFLSVGERQAPASGDLENHPAQDVSNHHGTIIRLHDDGRIPVDNPFVEQSEAGIDVRPEIWSYGHRNPQGLVIHPETGSVWINEHGPQGGDELNLIHQGNNYGWPVVGYGVNYGSGTTIHEGTLREGVEPPKHFWVPSIATSGLMVYTGDRFPEWRGNVFVGGMRGEQLARLVLDGDEITREETLVQGLGRIRDVRQGPDGLIYLAIDSRGAQRTPILRLHPADDDR